MVIIPYTFIRRTLDIPTHNIDTEYRIEIFFHFSFYGFRIFDILFASSNKLFFYDLISRYDA